MGEQRETYSPEAAELLKGAYDIHVHSNPSLGPGGEGFALDDFQVMEEAWQAGIRGVCLKNLEFSTIFRDYLVNRWQESQGRSGCTCYASLVLNGPVGGLNPLAVDYAVQQGARCVWFPTYSAQYNTLRLGWGAVHRERTESWNPALRLRFPADNQGISLLDEKGKIKPEVLEIIEIARDGEVALATGHMSPRDSFALCQAAVSMGHRKMILTHPDNRYTFVPDDMVEALAEMGVWIEKTYFSHVREFNADRAYEQVRRVGPEHFFLVSDTGQPEMPRPVQALGLFVDEYLRHGFSQAEVRRMTRDTPEFLIMP